MRMGQELQSDLEVCVAKMPGGCTLSGGRSLESICLIVLRLARCGRS